MEKKNEVKHLCATCINCKISFDIHYGYFYPFKSYMAYCKIIMKDIYDFKVMCKNYAKWRLEDLVYMKEVERKYAMPENFV